ncbi:MAG TPA: preprotein translocase subunit SecA [Desulfosporosinus sp.]|nr:preprotein translocase subunit SecA [Desulfosporosinus sp.]
MGFLSLFDDNAREVRKYHKRVVMINNFEPTMQAMSDDELRGKTNEFRARLEQGESLDNLLPEAYAVVREASRRVIDQRHYDVQLIGGMVLHDGRIAEMRTGEGKTLVSTLPAYLNALTGRGVHIVTVNDYLAQRDSEWMGQIHKFLGLTIGLISHGLNYEERKNNYAADITYGTNNEFGFDYLRDNMVTRPEASVQREVNYAIVDEVDSILIDEARTPLIISGEADKPTELYFRVAMIIPRLKAEDDYKVIEKERVVTLTEQGVRRVESMLGVDNLYEDIHTELTHHINQGLKAQTLFKRDRDYVVKDGEVIIVDEFTGRLMIGRRYSEGLHQAIEAKENVKIEKESQTLATITFQNYFRMYKKLSGMTGTAMTEETEFQKIYQLDVVEIPTNKPMIRSDGPDVIYRTEEGKFLAAVESVIERHAKGQPLLVGTVSVEKSELLSDLLAKRGVPHQVLNAKYHEKEAEIVAQAGQLGMVTIATNMAGRGTDIILGEGVPELGGLHIIGTERHESRRIDNQLRGRAARQGDAGSTQFFISIEDDLMRMFGTNIMSVMDKLGMDDTMPIESRMVSKSIETAQRRVESRNFDIRKHVLDYDDVMNQQREVIYGQRRSVLMGDNLRDNIMEMLEKVVKDSITMFSGESEFPEEWDLEGFSDYIESFYLPGTHLKPKQFADLSVLEIDEMLTDKAKGLYESREALFGTELMREIERAVMLQVVDSKWMDHLDAMDMLREGIGLRAYGQKDPLVEYRREGFEMFQAMIDSIQDDIIRYVMRVAPQVREEVAEPPRNVKENLTEEVVKEPVRLEGQLRRNDLCSCGSGKKYKKCCGLLKK